MRWKPEAKLFNEYFDLILVASVDESNTSQRIGKLSFNFCSKAGNMNKLLLFKVWFLSLAKIQFTLNFSSQLKYSYDLFNQFTTIYISLTQL